MRSPVLVLLVALTTSCAAARTASLREPAQAVPLVEDLFARDHGGSVTEEDLRRILDAPVALEEGARIGVVPVVDRYDPSADAPTVGAPGALARALEDTGLFDLVSEVSTDFPATSSVAGLRELAARYRADYLLLYRHRFVERTRLTPWLVRTTYETEAVLEATLFEVKTGTILFTVFQRAEVAKDDAAYDAERVQRVLRGALVNDGSRALGDDVVAKVRRLAAAVSVGSAARP